MKWFMHQGQAHRDKKLKKVLMRYGAEGYGLYWYCLEQICSDLEPRLTFELEQDVEILAHELKIDSMRVEEMMRYMVNQELFQESGGVIYCMKLAAHLGEKLTRNKDLQNIIRIAKSGNKPAKSPGLPPTAPDCPGHVPDSPGLSPDCPGEREEEREEETITSSEVISDPKGSAAIRRESPVDNSSLTWLESLYDDPENGADDKPGNLFSIGVKYLGRYGIEESRARAFLGKLTTDHGRGAVLDALLEVLSRRVKEPIPYMQATLKGRRGPMPLDWEPGPGICDCLRERGIHDTLIRDAVAFFRLWITDRGVESADFDAWFAKWVIEDHERADGNSNLLARWYDGANRKIFREPA